MDEQREIPGFPGYVIQRDGRVFSAKHRKIGLREVRQQRSAKGYIYVGLCLRGRKLNRRIHRLLLEAFVGPSNGLWGLHRNDDRSDNRLENLYWGTPQDNTNDAANHGLLKHGGRHPMRRLSAEQVLEIRSRYTSGETCKHLASEYGVSTSTTQRVAMRTSWKAA